MPAIDKIEIELTICIGRAKMPLNHFLALGRGAFIPLGGDERKPLDVLANGRKIAEGKVELNGDIVRIRLDKRNNDTAA